jgi:hypothetical protein
LSIHALTVRPGVFVTAAIATLESSRFLAYTTSFSAILLESLTGVPAPLTVTVTIKIL